MVKGRRNTIERAFDDAGGTAFAAARREAIKIRKNRWTYGWKNLKAIIRGDYLFYGSMKAGSMPLDYKEQFLNISLISAFFSAIAAGGIFVEVPNGTNTIVSTAYYILLYIAFLMSVTCTIITVFYSQAIATFVTSREDPEFENADTAFMVFYDQMGAMLQLPLLLFVIGAFSCGFAIILWTFIVIDIGLISVAWVAGITWSICVPWYFVCIPKLVDALFISKISAKQVGDQAEREGDIFYSTLKAYYDEVGGRILELDFEVYTNRLAKVRHSVHPKRDVLTSVEEKFAENVFSQLLRVKISPMMKDVGELRTLFAENETTKNVPNSSIRTLGLELSPFQPPAVPVADM